MGTDRIPTVILIVRALPNLLGLRKEQLKALQKFSQLIFLQIIHLPVNLDGNPLGNTTGSFLNLQAVALLFRPNKRLGPVNPGSAQLHMEAVHLLEPGTTTQAIAGLKQQHIEATVFEITGRRNPSETTTNDNNIN